MPTITRPTGDQLTFNSNKTGDHVLDDYLESAEKGTKTLGQLMDEIFDSAGSINQDFVQLRLNNGTSGLQIRSGLFLDTESGWRDTGNYVFRQRGAWASATAYKTLDCVSYSGSYYVCTTDHTSSGSIDLSKFSLAASQGAQGPTGPQGLQGPTGPTGPQGPTGTVSSASGIAFPATQVPSSDPNTLDDYEEGTWTPSILFVGGNGTASFSFSDSVYTKIGREVTYSTIATCTTIGTASGVFRIAGILTAAATAVGRCSPIPGSPWPTATNCPVSCTAPSGFALLYFTNFSAADVTAAHFSNGVAFRLSITMFV